MVNHLEEIKMSYFTHMRHAFSYALKSASASIIFIIHGIFPNTFTHLGYHLTKEIVKSIEDTKHK